MPDDAKLPRPTLPAGSATVVVVPRERFSLSIESLDALYANTEPPFDVVYVDGGSPAPIAGELVDRAGKYGFSLLRSERYLTPNQARNIGAARATGRYVVFIDNDLFVHPGWLAALVDCAETTGAAVVGPLYLVGPPGDEVVHMVGGDITVEGQRPNRQLSAAHRHAYAPLVDVAHQLQRDEVDYVEFHCMLVRRDFLDQVGPFDEALMSTREHIDFCLQAREAGGEVWAEPGAVVTYRSPPPFARYDVPFYWRRWSVAWTRASLDHFCEKHGVDPGFQPRALRKIAGRRLKVLQPVSQRVHRAFGKTGGRVFDRALRLLEPRLNRLLVPSAHARGRDDAPSVQLLP